MKRIISLVLACMMIFGALTLSSCVPIKKIDDAQNTTAQETTAQEKPVPVDSLNGMNAKQLLEKFFDDYKKIKSLDAELNVTSTTSYNTVTENMVVKFDWRGKMYTSIDMGETDIELWYADEVTYLNMGGDKCKLSGANAKKVFDDDVFDYLADCLISKTHRKFNYAYNKKLEAAQIYSYRGYYYFALSFSEKEVRENDMGSDAFVKTISLNADGAVTRIMDKSKYSTMILDIKSYDKKVDVAMPDDTDSFAAQPSTYTVDYLAYKYICKMLREATIYSMYVSVNDKSHISYSVNRQGERICVDNKEVLWRIDGKGYCWDGEETIEIPLSDKRFSDFDLAEPARADISDPIDKDMIKSLKLSNGIGITMISFEVEYAPGTSEVYSISVRDNFESVAINVIVEENYTVVDYLKYSFCSINDENLVIRIY